MTIEHQEPEPVRRKTYDTSEAAKRERSDQIEPFYNPKQRYSCGNDLSPLGSKKRYSNGSRVSGKLVTIEENYLGVAVPSPAHDRRLRVTTL